MRRFLNPVVLIVTLVIALGFAYAASRLAGGWLSVIVLAIPFFLVWIVPLIYWVGDREERGKFDESMLVAAYVSMGLLTYLLFFLLVIDIAILTASFIGVDVAILSEREPAIVFAFACLAMAVGLFRARTGPMIREVIVPIEGLPHGLEDFRIVQISDLHVGPTIGRAYVERVVAKTKELKPDLVALTGDIVDGSVRELENAIEPLGELRGHYFAMGNHDYYSGSKPWIEKFRKLGYHVLLNEHLAVEKNGARLMVAGVLDPAAKMDDVSLKPDPAKAIIAGPLRGDAEAFKLLLAHNPKLAPLGEKAGFDLMLSGHTHAGQFFPWTLVVRRVHKPHYWGLSRQGRMWVYVSAGTGTWGPPLRLGTTPELTLLRLKRAEV